MPATATAMIVTGVLGQHGGACGHSGHCVGGHAGQAEQVSAGQAAQLRSGHRWVAGHSVEGFPTPR